MARAREVEDWRRKGGGRGVKKEEVGWMSKGGKKGGGRLNGFRWIKLTPQRDRRNQK